ncbi:MAG: AAA family ATPase [Planctomycetaceae bacterium]|jgi:predicted ATPase|nr:AAA family ATPase [Planctomycetaceae bacterium]
MYVSRLTARNWRNFTKIDVAFQETVYLVGPNASGKSNFLDIFRFMRDVVSPKGGGLQKAIANRGGLKKIRSLAARQHPNIELSFELKQNLSSLIPDWIYTLSFQGDRAQRVKIVSESVRKNGKEILSRPNQDDQNDPERLTQTFLEQINANKDFREIADFFDDVLYLHLIPQLLRFGNLLAAQRLESDPFGQGFLDEVAVTPKKIRDSRLTRINRILQNVIPQFKELTFERDHMTGSPHLKMLSVHWRDKEAWQTEDQFSDGTLRLISLLWTLMSSNNLVLLEEPELSLHGSIVEQIPKLIRETRSTRKTVYGQIFVSTHSEQLLSDRSLDGKFFLIVRPGEKGESPIVEPLGEDDLQAIRAGIPPADIVFGHTKPTVGRLIL